MTESKNNDVEEPNPNPTSFFLGLMHERTPERTTQLNRIVEDLAIHFEIDDVADRCLFRSDSKTGKIVVGLKGACRLLGHCCAYVGHHYNTLLRIKFRDETGANPRALPLDDELQALSKLLTKSVLGDIECKSTSIANLLSFGTVCEDLSSLIDIALPRKARNVAVEVYANAIVWILYHELSHIQFGHVACGGLESLDQEREADRSAADWMLGSTDVSNGDLNKRQWGMVSALGWLSSTCAFVGTTSQLTHPAAYDRLFQTVNEMYYEENHDVWLYVQCMTSLHLLLAGLSFNEDQIGPPLKENASRLIDVIADAGRR